MNTKDFLSKRYESLCITLGDLCMQRDRAEEKIKAVKAEVAALEMAGIVCDQVEAQAAREQSGPTPV